MTGVRLLTIGEAARVLDCSKKTVRRRIAAGLLAVYRDGGLVRVPEYELERYVAARVVAPARPPASPHARRVGSGRARSSAKSVSARRDAPERRERLWDAPDPLRG